MRCLLPSSTKLRRLCFYTCLSVHRGGGVCLSACWDTISPSRHTPPGTDTPLLTDTRPRAHTPADSYCCGRYASYWNAFLFSGIFAIALLKHSHLNPYNPLVVIEKCEQVVSLSQRWYYSSHASSPLPPFNYRLGSHSSARFFFELSGDSN